MDGNREVRCGMSGQLRIGEAPGNHCPGCTRLVPPGVPFQADAHDLGCAFRRPGTKTWIVEIRFGDTNDRNAVVRGSLTFRFASNDAAAALELAHSSLALLVGPDARILWEHVR